MVSGAPELWCVAPANPFDHRYHGKCLKIARGKVKEDDKYTCPICDWRVKIPRDAARPKLEELQAWQDELLNLPFQPEEEECLNKIVSKAADFRAFMAPFIKNHALSSPEELVEQRFYLRKIEGADILLAAETNFFRQALHKWAPVAPMPPPMVEMSVSTRKPRPTKQQKMMAQLGIDNPEDLPPEFRTKQQNTKNRKASDVHSSAKHQPLQPAADPQSHTPPGLPHGMSLGDTSTLDSNIAGRQEPHPTFSYDSMHPSTSFEDSPLFAPATAFTHSAFDPTTTTVAGYETHLDPGLFDTPDSFSRRNEHASNSPLGGQFGSSSQVGAFDNIFADLTNHDDPLATVRSMAESALDLTADQDGDALVNDFLNPNPSG